MYADSFCIDSKHPPFGTVKNKLRLHKTAIYPKRIVCSVKKIRIEYGSTENIELTWYNITIITNGDCLIISILTAKIQAARQ